MGVPPPPGKKQKKGISGRTQAKMKRTLMESARFSLFGGSYRVIRVMRDHELILFSVKREFRKLLFVIRDLKVLRDP